MHGHHHARDHQIENDHGDDDFSLQAAAAFAAEDLSYWAPLSAQRYFVIAINFWHEPFSTESLRIFTRTF